MVSIKCKNLLDKLKHAAYKISKKISYVNFFKLKMNYLTPIVCKFHNIFYFKIVLTYLQLFIELTDLPQEYLCLQSESYYVHFYIVEKFWLIFLYFTCYRFIFLYYIVELNFVAVYFFKKLFTFTLLAKKLFYFTFSCNIKVVKL